VVQLDGIGPLYQQICRAFRGEILSRTLAAGERVPSTRALAALLKVSRNTALMAYEQLLAEGYLEARVGAAGTVVSSALPSDVLARSPAQLSGPQSHAHMRAGVPLSIAGARLVSAARAVTDSLGLAALTWELPPVGSVYDFRPGRAAFADLPYALWCRLLGSRARSASMLDLDYGPPAGQWDLREAIARRLRRVRGIEAAPERVVIVNGTQQALDLLSRLVLNPGDRVLIEEPHYTGARCAFTAVGGRLVPAPVDAEGIQVPKGIKAKRSIRLAYVTPSHQFPTGVILPVARRLELLSWASRVGAYILEDDYDGEYRYDGPPLQALAGLDREDRVIYLGTFSKTLFPALRLAYLVVPESLVAPLATAKALADAGTATLEQLVLADFITYGHFDRHLHRTNATNSIRRNALVDAVRREFAERAEICGANAGLHVLVWLKGKNGGKVADLAHKAHMVGVGLYPVDSFYLKAPRRTGVLLGYAPLRERDIREGIRRLAKALT